MTACNRWDEEREENSLNLHTQAFVSFAWLVFSSTVSGISN